MTVQVRLTPEVERQLRGNALTKGVTLEAYLDDLVARAAQNLPSVETVESDGEAGEEECPWRGILVLPIPRQELFPDPPEAPVADFPRRPAACNMNWHRVGTDDE
jgi:hypothetical protein